MGRRRGGHHSGSGQGDSGWGYSNDGAWNSRSSRDAGGAYSYSSDSQGYPHTVYAAPVVITRIDKIKFSQHSCSEKFKSRDQTVWDTADELGHSTRRRDIPMMKAYEKDGEYHSLDHRRLVGVKMASKRGDIGQTIKIDVDDTRKFAKDYHKKNSTKTNGERIRVSGTGYDVDTKGNVWKGSTRVEATHGWRPGAEDHVSLFEVAYWSQ